MLAMLYCFLFYNIHHTFLNKKKIEYEKSNKRGVSKVCYMTNSIIELYPAATNRMRPLNPSPLLTMSQHKGLLSLWNNNTSWVQLPSLGMDTRSPENPLWSRGPTKWDYFFCSWNENRTPRNLELYLPLFQRWCCRWWSLDIWCGVPCVFSDRNVGRPHESNVLFFLPFRFSFLKMFLPDINLGCRFSGLRFSAGLITSQGLRKVRHRMWHR